MPVADSRKSVFDVSCADIPMLRNELNPFNYKDVAKGKNLKQNIELKPGDTVIVP